MEDNMAKRSYKKRKQPAKKIKKTASKIDLTVIGLILLSILPSIITNIKYSAK